VRGFDEEIFIERRERLGLPARGAESAIAEGTLRVGEVAEDLTHAPLRRNPELISSTPRC
jgi:hypothetical protein